MLRGKELKDAEQWLGQAESSNKLRPILLRKEVRDLVGASRRASSLLRVLKTALATAFVLLLVFVTYVFIQNNRVRLLALYAELRSNEAEAQAKLASDQQEKAEAHARLAESRLGEIHALKRQLGIEDSDDKNQEINNAGIEIQKMREVSRAQSIHIAYFHKARDKTNVKATLDSVGYRVSAEQQRGNAPTNAIWWGEGIALEDVQFIAYTLIQNKCEIRYIGKMTTAGRIQIGGRPQSVTDPFWTVDKVRALTQYR